MVVDLLVSGEKALLSWIIIKYVFRNGEGVGNIEELDAAGGYRGRRGAVLSVCVDTCV